MRSGGYAKTFTIITTDANASVTNLHDRMRVILMPQDRPTWLGKVDNDPRTLLGPAAEDVLRVWVVRQAANSLRHSGMVVLEAIPITSPLR